jgi:N-acetylmuramoyl-L-alanine amidase
MSRVVMLVVLTALFLAAPETGGTTVSLAQQLCIVIDPGHGGRDAGSMGVGGLKEKTVSLAVAQRLAELLSGKLDARAVLTRRGDYYVSLEDRAKEANRAEAGRPADLLISIHVNACMERTVSGFQVFYASKKHELGLDEIIQMEGSAPERRELSRSYQENAQSALWDSQYRKHAEASEVLASSIAAALENRLAMHKLRTAPAVLRLLRGVDMPAVLVEIGFMSNGTNEAMLSSDEFQDTCAQALLEGIVEYRTAMLDRLFQSSLR